MEVVTEKSFLDDLEKENINPETLQEKVVEALKKKGLHLATAESCTGGLVSEKITEVSGSSEVFDCGICSYANFIKHKVLGVDEEILKTKGAVSAECAMEMAKGVAKIAKADIGVSTTGIAGPTGGTATKPVGLVYIGVYTKDKNYAVKTLLNEKEENSRNKVRKLASWVALYKVLGETDN